MQRYTSRNGEHWKQFDGHLRPVARLPMPLRILYRLGHLLLVPCGLLTIAFTRASLRLLGQKAQAPVASVTPQAHPGEIITPSWHCSQAESPHVSIVIPFYNRAAEVGECLSSILALRMPAGTRAEIIAVDNGSTDSTIKRLQQYPVTVLECKTRGPAAARNVGWKAARAPIVAFTDSDCAAEPGWLATLLQLFADSQVLFAGGFIEAKHVDTGPSLASQLFGFLDNRVFFRGNAFFPPFLATANAVYRRDVLQSCDGFDEKIWMSEDADLAWRALDLGGTAVYEHAAKISHSHRETVLGLWQQAVGYGEASVAVFCKHRARFNTRAAVDWVHWRMLAWLPLDVLWCMLTKSGIARTAPVYLMVWDAGFALGCMMGSLRHRVVYL